MCIHTKCHTNGARCVAVREHLGEYSKARLPYPRPRQVTFSFELQINAAAAASQVKLGSTYIGFIEFE